MQIRSFNFAVGVLCTIAAALMMAGGHYAESAVDGVLGLINLHFAFND